MEGGPPGHRREHAPAAFRAYDRSRTPQPAERSARNPVPSFELHRSCAACTTSVERHAPISCKPLITRGSISSETPWPGRWPPGSTSNDARAGRPVGDTNAGSRVAAREARPRACCSIRQSASTGGACCCCVGRRQERVSSFRQRGGRTRCGPEMTALLPAPSARMKRRRTLLGIERNAARPPDERPGRRRSEITANRPARSPRRGSGRSLP